MEDSLNIRTLCIPTSLEETPYIVTLNKYGDFSDKIGCRALDVVCLWDDGETSVDCFLDDEGMINNSPVNNYWLRSYLRGFTIQPFYGKALISMTNLDTGESIDIDPVFVSKILKENFGFTDFELSALNI